MGLSRQEQHRGSDEWLYKPWHAHHRHDRIASAITLNQMIHWPLILSNKKGGHSRTVKIILQTEGVFVNGPTHFLELINLVRVLFHTFSRDRFCLGVLKLVAGAATSIVTTYPELPPLSFGHIVAVRSSSLDFYQHRRTTRVPGLVTTLACSPMHSAWDG